MIKKDVQLKNGETVTIRSAEIYDAQKLMLCVQTYIADSDFIPKNPEEFTLTLNQEIGWIQSFSKENSLLLVAEHHNQIIANIDVTGSPRQAMQHTAVIGMGMLSEWRNSGLGTALMQTAVSWAQQNTILEKLWLQVYADNVLGLSLYRKMGFEENGTIKDFFKQNSRYHDVITMSRSVV